MAARNEHVPGQRQPSMIAAAAPGAGTSTSRRAPRPGSERDVDVPAAGDAAAGCYKT